MILMCGFIAILVLQPENGENAVKGISYITTAFVALRATYSMKSAIENYKKISSNFRSIANNDDDDDDYFYLSDDEEG